MKIVFEKEGWRWVADPESVEQCLFCSDHRTAATVRVVTGHYVVRLCRVHRPKGKRDATHIGLRIRAALAQTAKVKPAPAPVARQLVLL